MLFITVLPAVFRRRSPVAFEFAIPVVCLPPVPRSCVHAMCVRVLFAVCTCLIIDLFIPKKRSGLLSYGSYIYCTSMREVVRCGMQAVATGHEAAKKHETGQLKPSNSPSIAQIIQFCTRFMVRRRDFRLSLQPSSSSSSSSNFGQGGAAPNSSHWQPPSLSSSFSCSSPRGGGDQENPPPSHPASNNSSSSGGRGGRGGSGFVDGRSSFAGRGAMGGDGRSGSGNASAIAREISLEMSPCMPVHVSCGFVIERNGIRGVGR